MSVATESSRIIFPGDKSISNRFLISDTHFGHEKCWKEFKREDGSPMRNFSSTEEMDQTMVDNWNRIVGPNDKVYHLGDVVINRRFLQLLDRLNGRKVLVAGNHDIFDLEDYYAYFEDVKGVAKLDLKQNGETKGFYLTHIPIHPAHIPAWCSANIHGHLHYRRVTDKWGNVDPRYICVCVEHTNYSPVPLEEIEKYR